MGVNHYSQFLITHELLGLLKATPKSRVVHTSSSISKKLGNTDPYIDLDDLEWKRSNQKFVSFHRYGNSKLANVLFGEGLARFFRENKIEAKSVSVHPGAIKSSFGRSVNSYLNSCILCCISACAGNVVDGCQSNLACIYRKYEDLEDGMYYVRLEV